MARSKNNQYGMRAADYRKALRNEQQLKDKGIYSRLKAETIAHLLNAIYQTPAYDGFSEFAHFILSTGGRIEELYSPKQTMIQLSDYPFWYLHGLKPETMALWLAELGFRLEEGSINTYSYHIYLDHGADPVLPDFIKLSKDDESEEDYFVAQASIWNKPHSIIEDEVIGRFVELYPTSEALVS